MHVFVKDKNKIKTYRKTVSGLGFCFGCRTRRGRTRVKRSHCGFEGEEKRKGDEWE